MQQGIKTAILSALCALSLNGFAQDGDTISPEQFKRFMTVPEGTMRYVEYLGVSGDKACLALHEMSLLGSRNWTRKTLCVDTSTLEPGYLESLSKPAYRGLADVTEVAVRDGQFYLDDAPVPAACIARLAPSLNGDDTVAAVYLARTAHPGCMEANAPGPKHTTAQFSYTIEGEAGNGAYRLKVCEAPGAGSMDQHCSQITVLFASRNYLTPAAPIKVLTVEKLGEW